MPACQTRGQAALDESRRYVGRPVGQVVIRGLSTRCRVLILRFAHRRMAVECTRTNHRLCSRRSKQPRLHLHVACNTSRLACWTRETLPNIHYIAKSSSAGPSTRPATRESGFPTTRFSLPCRCLKVFVGWMMVSMFLMLVCISFWVS